jgi:hypothetical protein
MIQHAKVILLATINLKTKYERRTFMYKTKRLLVLLLVVTLLVAIMPISAFAAENEDDMILVYAQVPDDWTGVCLWAWDADGVNAFDAWPGGVMTPDEINAGWYYCYVPSTMVNIIINANEGSVQTSDCTIEAKNTWVVIEPAEDGYSAVPAYEQMTEGDLPEYVATITVHAKAPEDWAGVSLWAWSAPDGTNVFANWPGEAMSETADGWYTYDVPAWVNSVIINANEGMVQTSDISIESKDVWITVEDPESAEVSYEQPVAEDETFTVHAKAPDDWEAVSLWAWSAPDGTNVFANWPGEEMSEEGDWYTYNIPTWVNSIIINANMGTVQTSDVSVEAQDLWIVVQSAESYEVYYEEPDLSAVAETETEATPAPTEEPVVETATQPQPSLTWLWIVIGVVVVAAVATLIIVANKKKKA